MGHPPFSKHGGQGAPREVGSGEPEARSRAVTNCFRWEQREPVGQAEDAEPAARWRRHILDESVYMVFADSTGPYLSNALTRGGLVKVWRRESSGRGPYKRNRNWSPKPWEVTHEPVVVRKRG